MLKLFLQIRMSQGDFRYLPLVIQSVKEAELEFKPRSFILTLHNHTIIFLGQLS